MLIPIVIIISIIFITVLTFISGKQKVKQNDSMSTSTEIFSSVGIIISFFLPWLTFTINNLGFGSETQTQSLSWFNMTTAMRGGYHGLHLSFMGTGEIVIICLPLIMAIINIFFLIIERARGWSFYTGIATFGWTALCIYGNNDAPDITTLGFGFVIGSCCALSITISSLITMIINPKEHLSFLLGHLSTAIFGVIAFLFLILLNATGIEMDSPLTILTSFNTASLSSIPIILCLITALALTLICDYYQFMYINGHQKRNLTKDEQSTRNQGTGNEDAETILDQHWMYCTKCGTKCKDYLKFCPRCGFGLHPEREESSSEYSSYAPPVETPDQPEYIPLKENTKSIGSTIPVIDNQIRPVVTKTRGAIHVENKVHPTIESSPEPQVKESPKVVEQKIPASPSAATGNKWRLWVLIAFAVLLVGAFPAYLFWYKPYVTDRDAPRYFTFTNLNLRSSKIADVKHNLLELLPYGTELITYSIDADWANVKVGGLKGYVASNLILSKADFELLNSVWGNTNAKECINTAKCRLAVLDYYKRFNMSGGTEWQIFTAGKESRINNMYYRRIYNPNSKFTDFTFIVKNNRTKERELVIYSFDDETEKPIYRTARRLSSSESGYIKSITSSNGWIDILFTDGGWIQISVSR